MKIYFPSISPAFDGDEVAIFLSTDDNYALPCGVTIQSIITHSSPNRNYDIVIGQNRLSERYKRLLLNLIENRENFSIRFYDMPEEISDIQLHISGYVTIATYYRIFLVDIFREYNKVLYLDVDLVALKDVGILYDTEMGDNWIAGCRDYGMMQRMNLHIIDSCEREWIDYFSGTMGLNNPLYQYVNAGVLIFNLSQCRQHNVMHKMIEISHKHELRFHDQDLINEVCQNHIVYLDPAWNYSHPMNRVLIPEDLWPAHERASKAPYIMHFLVNKPWKTTSYREGGIWWNYASMTPFLGELLYRFLEHSSSKTAGVYCRMREYEKKYRLWRVASWFSFGKMRRKCLERKRYYRGLLKGL